MAQTHSGTIDRRTFLWLSLAISGGLRAQGRPVTLTEWLEAPIPDRRRAIDSLVAHVKQLDAEVHAWSHLAAQPTTDGGPLAQVPFGVKDVIETAGLPTEYGSPLYKGRRATETADIVARIRARGAVLLGKTHTTAFAYRTPPPTRNPRNLAHTPGGSSSGSAAAVAARMVPVAIGTQTGGSTIRPASYCGVTGFKTSYGLLPMRGVLPFAASLDTLGFFTHSAADMLAFWRALGQDVGTADVVAMAAVDPLPDLEEPMARAFRDTVSRLRASGLSIRPLDMRSLLVELHAAQQTVMFFEGARFHETRYKEFGDRLEHIAELVRKGMQISTERYGQAKEFIAACRNQTRRVYAETPIVLAPSATGPAPRGLEYTGSSTMNSPWTALGTPAVSIPMPVGGSLPLGLQLTADHGQDARVLQVAAAVERMLR